MNSQLPQKFRLRASVAATIPISYYSQLESNITSPSGSLSLSRKFGDLAVEARWSIRYAWDRYSTAGGLDAGGNGPAGATNLQWGTGGSISAEYDMPFYRPVSAGVAPVHGLRLRVVLQERRRPPPPGTPFSTVQRRTRRHRRAADAAELRRRDLRPLRDAGPRRASRATSPSPSLNGDPAEASGIRRCCTTASFTRTSSITTRPRSTRRSAAGTRRAWSGRPREEAGIRGRRFCPRRTDTLECVAERDTASEPESGHSKAYGDGPREKADGGGHHRETTFSVPVRPS